MTDYTKSTGSSGTMMIRDTGTYVEFWLKAGSSTFNHDLPWRYTVNGVTSSKKFFDFQSGGDYQKLGSWLVTYDQTVNFYLYDSGTSGIGGPTSFSVAINRASAPSAPSIVTISNITSTSVDGAFTDGSSNGATIDTRQIGYGTSSSSPQNWVTSDKSTTITGLTPGTTYYFWARTHNAEGWSPYGPRSSAKTYDVPEAPSSVTVSEITQSSVKTTFTPNSDGGTPVLEWELAYGQNAPAPDFFALTSGTLVLTGLDPGARYYFWARGRNSVGWGPYSLVTSATLIAGAWVKFGTVWKRAVPYVNDNGVWKMARPWARIAGLWKETG